MREKGESFCDFEHDEKTIALTKCCMCGRDVCKEHATSVMKTANEVEIRLFKEKKDGEQIKVPRKINIRKSLGWKCKECITDVDISREKWLKENHLFEKIKEEITEEELKDYGLYVQNVKKTNVSLVDLKNWAEEFKKK